MINTAKMFSEREGEKNNRRVGKWAFNVLHPVWPTTQEEKKKKKLDVAEPGQHGGKMKESL